MKNPIQSLVTVVLGGFSLASLSLPSVAVNITVLSQNTKAVTNLIAEQRVSCRVVGIKRGQLALRYSPGGAARAGLDNGNSVVLLDNPQGDWVSVRVVSGPNRAVNGLKGWVNNGYLNCNT